MNVFDIFIWEFVWYFPRLTAIIRSFNREYHTPPSQNFTKIITDMNIKLYNDISRNPLKFATELLKLCPNNISVEFEMDYVESMSC